MLFFKRNRIVMPILLFLAGCTGGSTWIPIVDHHRRTHPRMELDDVYKLIYQGTLGAEHALHDTMAAKKYLFDEFRHIDTTEFREEPLTEFISADSSLVRINLRPFKRQGGDVQALWGVVMAGAHGLNPKSVFIRNWQSLSGTLSKLPFTWNPATIDDFNRKVKNLHYPAMHHSEKYTKAYKPAYRVVFKAEFDKLNRQ